MTGKTPVTALLWQQREHIKPVHGGYVGATYLFASDKSARDLYANAWGGVRAGKLLEDLDALAGNAAAAHVLTGDWNGQPPVLVTACVDEINLHKLLPLEDLQLYGNVTWTGKSSMEVRMFLQPMTEGTAPLLEAFFVFAARDRSTGKSASIPQFVPETEEEGKWFAEGVIRAQKRKDKRQLASKAPALLQDASVRKWLAEGHALLDLPGRGLRLGSEMLSRNTTIENTVVTMPQHKNTAGRVFGGFLMRRAYELAFANALSFGGEAPKFLGVGEVSFIRPVEVGSVLRLRSRVLFTHENTCAIEVRVRIVNLEKMESHTSNRLLFHYIFPRMQHGLPRVLPTTEAEVLAIVEACQEFNCSTESIIGVT